MAKDSILILDYGIRKTTSPLWILWSAFVKDCLAIVSYTYCFEVQGCTFIVPLSYYRLLCPYLNRWEFFSLNVGFHQSGETFKICFKQDAFGEEGYWKVKYRPAWCEIRTYFLLYFWWLCKVRDAYPGKNVVANIWDTVRPLKFMKGFECCFERRSVWLICSCCCLFQNARKSAVN